MQIIVMGTKLCLKENLTGLQQKKTILQVINVKGVIKVIFLSLKEEKIWMVL
jgi:hypothetical protein